MASKFELSEPQVEVFRQYAWANGRKWKSILKADYYGGFAPATIKKVIDEHGFDWLKLYQFPKEGSK